MKNSNALSVVGLSFAMLAAPVNAADPGGKAGHVHDATKAPSTSAEAERGRHCSATWGRTTGRSRPTPSRPSGTSTRA